MKHAYPPLLALTCYYRRGGYSGIVELTRHQDKEEHMIRHWIQLILLTLLVLIQAACPKYFTHQTNEDARVHTPNDHSDSDNGNG